MDNILTIGLGFGDEGKGSFIDYLSYKYPNYDTIIRYNGGSQARHTVELETGKRFVFSQLSPALYRNSKSQLYLYSNFIVNLQNLIYECEEFSKFTGWTLKEILSRIYIDKSCLIVTPYHKVYNCLIEEKYKLRGSTGSGVSIANLWSTVEHGSLDIYAEDLYNLDILKNILENQREYLKEKLIFEDINFDINSINIDEFIKDIQKLVMELPINIGNYRLVLKDLNCIYESSQGFLLDKNYGFYPNTTYMDTSMDSLNKLKGKRIGFIRSLYTRHGSGVFPTEEKELNKCLKDESQEIGKYNGSIRFGWFDCVLMRYSIKNTCVNTLYMSYLDYLNQLDSLKICNGYILDKGIGGLDYSKLSEYFEYEEEDEFYYIRNINKVGDKISSFLSVVEPIYLLVDFTNIPYKERIQQYLSIIEDKIGIKIEVYSDGSLLKNKKVR